MGRTDFPRTTWRISSYSSGNGECVEVAFAGADALMRDSKNRAGATLAFGQQQWSALLGTVRDQH